MNNLQFQRLATQLWRALLLLCLLIVSSVPQIKAQSAAVDGTFQDFDNPGTPYTFNPGSPVPQAVISGEPIDTGNMLRLAFGRLPTHQNNIAFDRTASGAFDQIVADFDFRVSPGTGRADGFGFALLNTVNHGITGTVPLQPIAEEPSFVGSIGVGFDVHRAGTPPTEISNNHLSIHFNGTLLQEFDLPPELDLAIGRWVHARIIMRPGGGNSDISVILDQCGMPSYTVVDKFKVTGFTPYEGRVHFAARSGGLTANHDIDNVRVNFLSLAESVINFSTGCYTVIETDGSRLLTITRTGNVTSTASVHYATTDLSAQAPSDYEARSGTLTFSTGQATKTLAIPIVNDASNESDEKFLVSLSNPSAGTTLGGPAVAKVTIVDNESAQAVGHWSDVIPSHVVPIHMHLLPTGKVLYWDRHDDKNGWDGRPRLWDPATGTISMAAMPMYDLFCSGHSFLADGRLLVTGGHIADHVGEDKATIYDPFTDSWTNITNMNKGRWYPSNVTLVNGDTLVLAGTFQPGQINPLPQIWQDATGTWRNLTNAQISTPAFADYYPFLYLAPNGKIFDAGPQQSSYYLDPSGAGAWSPEQTESSVEYRDYGSSVMYDDGKVLVVGGNKRDDTVLPEKSAEVIDLNGPSPVLRRTHDMNVGRRQLNTTLLPDGKVLVTGGSSHAGFDESSGKVLSAELWDPDPLTETWTVMASQTRYRGYHSAALLLPDGRVLVGGGGHPDPDSGSEYNFEIYSPPYLFKGARPTITNAPELVAYGGQFAIQTPSAATITQVTLVRLSSVTHSFNQNQRFKRLDFARTSGGLTATVPTNPNLLPPGYYMLFILNGNGVPSVGRMIRISNDVTVSIGGQKVGGMNIPPQSSQRTAYPINNGPVAVVSNVKILSAERVIWKEPGYRSSYSEMMGLPKEQLSTEYLFPWYNNAVVNSMDQGFRIANVDTASGNTVEVWVGSTKLDTIAIEAGGSVRVGYNVDNGPIRIVCTTCSNTSNDKIIAALRVIWQEPGQRFSYSEMMGLPKEQLSDEYWFPWYNNAVPASMDQGFRIANISATEANTVEVWVGTTQLDTISLNPGTSTRVSYNVDNGPIRIVCTTCTNTGSDKVIAALRVIWKEPGFRASYSEMMGMPKEQLSNEYWFPWYNNAVANSMDQGFRIANVSLTESNTVEVWVGTSKLATIPLSAGASTRVGYNVDNGPVRILCTTCSNSGSDKIITALRVIWKEPGFRSSYSEMMGLPAQALSTEYWFPWYNNAATNSMDQGFRIAVP